jgi:hypothetical protein
MTEQGAQSLEIAFAFNAPSRESVTKAMDFPRWKPKFIGDAPEMVPEGLGIDWFGISR